MESIEVHKTTNNCGFTAKPEIKVLEAVKFKNGKIAYLDGQSILSLDNEMAIEDHPNLKIVKSTKEDS